MQKLSGKWNEFGRRSGEQLELYRRSNLSGKRTEADSEGGKTKMNRIEDVTDYITECDKEVGEALEELEGGAVHVVPRKKK